MNNQPATNPPALSYVSAWQVTPGQIIWTIPTFDHPNGQKKTVGHTRTTKAGQTVITFKDGTQLTTDRGTEVEIIHDLTVFVSPSVDC